MVHFDRTVGYFVWAETLIDISDQKRTPNTQFSVKRWGFYLSKGKMPLFLTEGLAKHKLPTAICRLILLFEGGVVEDYIRCIVRRMCVRSYKRVLSHRFRFAMLPTFPVKHLCYLVCTQLQTFEQASGVIARNVSRVHIFPWRDLILRYGMKNQIHTTAVNLIFSTLHHMAAPTEFRRAWLEWQRDLIMSFG